MGATGRWITKLNQDGHIAIGLFIYVTGLAMHYFHGLDASFVAFTTTILGFLGGHAYLQKKEGSDDAGNNGAISQPK